MTWYAAHIVMYVELQDEAQAYFPVWENIVLTKASSEAEAFRKAEQRGREEASDDETFRWGGKPARWVFAGVRKLTSCQDEEKRPGDGTEISFTEMELPSLEAIRKLVEGGPVAVKLVERFGSTTASNRAK